MRAFYFVGVLLVAHGATAQIIQGTYRSNDLSGLRRAVEKDPDNAGLRLRLSQALLRSDTESAHPERARQRLKEAQEQIRRILQLDGQAKIPLRVSTLESYSEKRFEDAVRSGRALLEIDPLESEVAKAVLKALVRLDRQEEAAQFFVEWLESGHGPDFGTVTGLLAVLVPQPKFRAAFEKGMAEAVVRSPRSVNLCLHRSIFFLETGRTESAWTEVHRGETLGLCDTRTGSRHPFTRILETRAPEFADSPGRLAGDDLRELGKYVESYPDNTSLVVRLARLHDLAGHSSEALSGFQKACELNPDYWPARFRVGRLLMEAGRDQDAVPHLETASRLAPSHVPGRLLEAEARFKAGDGARAVSIVVEMAALHEPGDWDQAFLKLVKDSGQLDQLVAALRGASQGEKPRPSIFAHLGQALMAGGKVTEAQQMALESERRGLSGDDGFPHPVIFEVFGEPLPHPRRPVDRG